MLGLKLNHVNKRGLKTQRLLDLPRLFIDPIRGSLLSWANFTNMFFITIQTWWKFHFVLIYIVMDRSPQNLAHETECRGMSRIPKRSFSTDFSTVIQIRWKIHPALIQVVLKWSLWNFALGTTTLLSWHVQNIVAIWYNGVILQCSYTTIIHLNNSIESELW